MYHIKKDRRSLASAEMLYDALTACKDADVTGGYAPLLPYSAGQLNSNVEWFLFAALGEKGINIRMISQGPDELNILVGVDEKDYAETIRVLYNAFVV